MAGGIGGFIAFPYTHLLIEFLGWKTSLLVLVATTAVMLPLALPLSGKPVTNGGLEKPQTLGEAFKEALTHPSYLLLTAGFFVCGFHVAFYSVHLPAFVADKGLDASVAVIALTMVGLGNLAGTYIAGQSGRFIEKRRGLSLIYFGRCFVFLGLLFLPMTPVTVIAPQHAARPVLAVDRAAHLEPGGDLLRHHLDVDAVRRRVPVAPARVVHRPLDGRLSLRHDRVV